MGGGAQPGHWFDFLRRWCLVLAAALIGHLAGGIAAQAAPAATATTAAPSASAPAQAQPTRPRKFRFARRPKHERSSERSSERASSDLGERLNKNTLVIVSGGIDSTNLAITHQLSAVLGDGDDLRILPMVGAGGSRNIRDVRFMKGIDLGITQTNVLARLRQSGEIGGLDDKIVYQIGRAHV